VLVESDLRANIDDRRITGYHGSSQLWDCSGLFFGKLFGAHLVHKTLQMGCFCATDSTLSDSKQMKRGVYEQGRKIGKPPQCYLNKVEVCSYNGLCNRCTKGCEITSGLPVIHSQSAEHDAGIESSQR
jgi:hypothetical protein